MPAPFRSKATLGESPLAVTPDMPLGWVNSWRMVPTALSLSMAQELAMRSGRGCLHINPLPYTTVSGIEILLSSDVQFPCFSQKSQFCHPVRRNSTGVCVKNNMNSVSQLQHAISNGGMALFWNLPALLCAYCTWKAQGRESCHLPPPQLPSMTTTWHWLSQTRYARRSWGGGKWQDYEGLCMQLQ